MTSLKKIAQKSGVCVETVSRVLNGKYKGRTERSRLTMRKVLHEAQKLNYRPNTAARSMRTRETGLIGVIINECDLNTHPVFSETLKGINNALKKSGYLLTINSLNGLDPNPLKSRIFKEQLLDGIIILDNSSEERVQEMLQVIPNSVMINCNSFLPDCCIRRDEFHAGWQTGHELKKLGYTQFIYFNLNHTEPEVRWHYSFKARLQGLQSALENSDIELVRVNVKSGRQMYDWINEAKSGISPETVLVTSSNLHLYALMSSLSRMRLVAGEDFGLASLDDETGLNASFPMISRIHFPREKIGYLGGEMMVNLLAGDLDKCVSFEVTGNWIAGNTTRKVKKDEKK